MSPDKFRQWIIILLAALLVTSWLAVGLKAYKCSKYKSSWKKSASTRQARSAKCIKCGNAVNSKCLNSNL